ncbi:HD domain-containing protein [Pseudogracilibacillus sp. SE30717A]|uniref:HD domain-containing protein n=1 Tax=Pseudogracilibacillus sp. SE30717A TaxID=3098293 RepID=UPI00300DDE34
MENNAIIIRARQFVQEQHQNDYSGHDWWHIMRVTDTAKIISVQEGGNDFVVELAALMHDLADEKISGSEKEGLKKVNKWLKENGVKEDEILEINEIITTMSFKGGNRKPMSTIEGKIVQDADRLDALGAIGIARTFAYSGAKGQPIYDPELPPRVGSMTYKDYRHGKSTAINHFYEKLLKLKDSMNTEYGKKLAEERHNYMMQFLEQFFLEWKESEK